MGRFRKALYGLNRTGGSNPLLSAEQYINTIMKTGILVHGRHLETREWERIVWGEPPHKLGSLPTLIATALEIGMDQVSCIVFGTGASSKDGLTEAEYTKQFLLDNFDRVSEFPSITEHPDFQDNQPKLRALFELIICENTSQNTYQEIEQASKIFTEHGVTDVRQITCGSHAPRCIATQLRVRSEGGIPGNQRWFCTTDDMTYVGTSAADVTVIEPPHRGDDPMIDAPIQAHQVFRQFYGQESKEQKIEALKKIQEILKQH